MGSPTLVVPKNTGGVRLCGDYKVTVSPALGVNQYSLPQPPDLFTTLAEGKVFTKLDLTQAYHQMEVEENSLTVVGDLKNDDHHHRAGGGSQ